MKRRGGDIVERKRGLRRTTSFCIEISILVGLFHPAKINQIPRFVAIRTKGAVNDFAPFGAIATLRNSKRSVGDLPLIVWNRTRFGLEIESRNKECLVCEDKASTCQSY